jgi:hypothetical protein
VVGDGADAPQLIVVSLTAAKVAVSAGSMVISLDVLIVLAQLSVNVQVSVYVPPHVLCEPVMVEVTDPLISQLPV